MPELSRFFGIIIRMFYREHAPPHFHVRYGSKLGSFDIRAMRFRHSTLPPRIEALVQWASQHQQELADAWDMAHSGQTPNRIAPLT